MGLGGLGFRMLGFPKSTGGEFRVYRASIRLLYGLWEVPKIRRYLIWGSL